jgi:hypothetical protein
VLHEHLWGGGGGLADDSAARAASSYTLTFLMRFSLGRSPTPPRRGS